VTAVNSTSGESPSARRLLRGLRREFANWYVLGPIGLIALPSRCPPRGGLPFLAKRRIAVQMRGGARAECRIDELFPFVEVFVLDEYELPSVDWMQLETIVDIGANVGASTLWFAQKAPQAMIVAVEPSGEVLPSLIRNIRANGLRDRVRIVAAAVAARTSTTELHQGESSVSATIGGSPRGRSQRVRAVSLEDLLLQHDLAEVDVLKLDCEGAEYEILDSTDDDVLRRVRHIVGEYHARSRFDLIRLVNRLEQVGFDVITVGGDSLGRFQAERAR
jgi:FkbM family methyltransferase